MSAQTRRDAEHQRILQEVLAERDSIPQPPRWPYYLLGAVLIALMVAWYIPDDFFPTRANLKNIPTIDELGIDFTTPERPDSRNINQYVLNNDPQIKQAAVMIVTSACTEPDKHCYADALFHFVQTNINYAYDPVGEYYELPQETLLAKAADCDGHAVLLASLMQAVGIQTQFNYAVPNHVAVDARLQRKHLFDPDYVYDWFYYDPTCKGCEQGERRASP